MSSIARDLEAATRDLPLVGYLFSCDWSGVRVRRSALLATLAVAGLGQYAPSAVSYQVSLHRAIRDRLVNMHMGEPIIGLASVRKEKTLMELTSVQCRFPIWGHAEHPVEFLFCAEARIEESSYCKAHHKLCIAQPKGARP